MERPILFSAPMVRAIIDGAKTQTRRVVGLSELRRSDTPGYVWTWRGRAPIRSVAQQRRHHGGCWQDVSHERLLALCPHGSVGDRIWVRETWAPVARGEAAEDIRDCRIEYRADTGASRPGGWDAAPHDAEALRWRPSIHMPRWASRITLEITDVRVERLTSISEDDARSEGVAGVAPRCAAMAAVSFRGAFALLWDSINGKRNGCAWADDPWVWAISFRRVESP